MNLKNCNKWANALICAFKEYLQEDFAYQGIILFRKFGRTQTNRQLCQVFLEELLHCFSDFLLIQSVLLGLVLFRVGIGAGPAE